VLVAKLSIALVLLALVSFSFGFEVVIACEVMLCKTGLEVTVVGATKLIVVGVGLLLIKLSTSADVTLVCMVVENVLASGGTIGMKGIGCGGLIV
jgi:hypothetical protein